MPRLSVDLIEWDGQFFCVLMEPYLFIFNPYLDGRRQGVDLLKVFAVDGREITPDQHPSNRINLAAEVTVRIWQAWDDRYQDSLLRHPAVRIHVDPDYEVIEQRGTAEEIIARVFAHRRTVELQRLEKEARHRRAQGDLFE